MSTSSPYRPDDVGDSVTSPPTANLNSPLYVEVENGQRVVLPLGMREVDLLRSMLRQLLGAVSS